ncbi:Uu.00g113990.m01.CDS01 [Anthostomella pinea]|uniref:Uu.00g113990.m01.CDS01 n=1 Tax=Anthostomella pinea TaxID=933095 RepID=A0AAI8YGI1_9PEZI|nr:Uu.00g113990.m01.CDS01 [Anthostomella pinea]
MQRIMNMLSGSNSIPGNDSFSTSRVRDQGQDKPKETHATDIGHRDDDASASSSVIAQPARSDPNRLFQDPQFHQYVKQEATKMSHRDMQLLRDQIQVQNARIVELEAAADGGGQSPSNIDARTHVVMPKEEVHKMKERQRDLDATKEALADEKALREELNTSYQAAVDQLMVLRSNKGLGNFVVEDGDMVIQWKNLQFDIRDIAVQHIARPVPDEPLSLDAVQPFKPLSMLYKSFLQSKAYRRHIVQALIWDHLCRDILLVPTKIWGPEISDLAESLSRTVAGESNTEQSATDYHSWRAQTGQIIHNTAGTDEKTLESAVRNIGRALRPLVGDGHRQELKDSLKEVVTKAAELASIFSKSRSHYICRDIMENFAAVAYDDDLMQDVRQANRPAPVRLMLSPALVKYGNSKGKNYDKSIVLAKAVVFCCRPPK